VVVDPVNPLSKNLLDWYALNARQLPWRNNSDAYAVWISEIMLQQTRVETVVPYFERWMKQLPTIRHLASASEQEVLALWEGLGYYSRARNLHKAARMVIERYAGELPRDLPALQKLPGIGRYTAAAIASMAFGQDVATLDGNLKRVFARLYDFDQPVDTSAAEMDLWVWVEELLPVGRAGEYNQALMDLGAVICIPRNPRCLICPLAGFCLAQQRGTQTLRPVKRPKKEIPHLNVTAAVLFRDGKYLLAKRPAKGLLGGLWEFPGGKAEPGESLPQALQREICEELGASVDVGREFGVFNHAYTHFRITLHAFICSLQAGEPRPLEAQEIAWISPEDMEKFPMGKVDRLISRRLVGGNG
jgi:A/G-specific adenine glycosylase